MAGLDFQDLEAPKITHIGLCDDGQFMLNGQDNTGQSSGTQSNSPTPGGQWSVDSGDTGVALVLEFPDGDVTRHPIQYDSEEEQYSIGGNSALLLPNQLCP